MRNGDVVIVHRWSVDTVARTITGIGTRQDANRRPAALEVEQMVHLDSVALIESNVIQRSGAVAALTIVSGISAGVTAACLSNPKACFGSCPTFYVSDGKRSLLQAEGFSASISPSLEATDIDALYRAQPEGRVLTVRMTNEALETHVVRSVRVLAVPRGHGGKTFVTQTGAFREAREVMLPTRCTAREGDCLTVIRAVDDVERFSPTDSFDLAAREIIELEFPQGGDSLGLVLASRQTLLSTFVLYQTLAYMGASAGAMLAKLERGNTAMLDRSKGMARLLGPIEVMVQDRRGAWVVAGSTQETGPLATDVRYVPLPTLPAGPARIRLRLTRGHWRIDHVALAKLGERVEPIALEPTEVRRGEVVDDAVRSLLLDPARVLTTLPGDEFTFVFELPEHPERYELFLESRGYYLEWMRSEWLAEGNPALAMRAFRNPASALRAMAPAFKKREAEMESIFWGSRYVRH